MFVLHRRIRFVLIDALPPPTLDIEVQHHSVIIHRRIFLDPGLRITLVPPLHPVQPLFCAFQRDEAEALRENFVGHNGGVVVDIDFFYG
jgi:hypothetical protein